MHNQEARGSRRKLYLGVAIAAALIAGFCACVLYSFMRPQIALAKHKRTTVDLWKCSEALETFRVSHGGYPGGDWESAVRTLAEANLLDETLLRDHWGSPFVYVASREMGESLADQYTLRSCGEDRICEQQIPSRVDSDPADYASDIVIQSGDWRRARFGSSSEEP